MNANVFETVAQATAVLQAAGLDKTEIKMALTALVEQNWGPLPVFSTLDKPKIKETETASMGCAVVPVFQENGRTKFIMAQAGPHYDTSGVRHFMALGGFGNLTETEGSIFIAPSDKPETPFLTGAREMEEEMRHPDGRPVFAVDPERLELKDSESLARSFGNKALLFGMMMQLAAEEVTKGKEYIARLATDPVYRAACSAQTVNKESGKPEVDTILIFDSEDVANDRIPILHRDQLSLFRKIHQHFHPALVTA